MFIEPKSEFRGVILVPGDKSITHRAIMLNSIAKGVATITDALMGEDCLATIECMKALGADIKVDKDTIVIHGIKHPRSGRHLYVGNSGTSIRLLSGLVAGLGVSCWLDGDESIRKRPMKRVSEPLAQMGARIETNNGCAPVKIRSSSLVGIDYTMPVASAQVKSAILLAGLGASGQTIVRETEATRNHTEIMLEAMSADIQCHSGYTVVRKSSLKSIDIDVPGDISSAAYAIVLATALKNSSVVIKNVGVNKTRRAIIDVINAHGGRILLLNKRVCAGESVADILVESATIKPFEIGGKTIPNLIDEIPILAVLASCIEGTSVIRDAQELKVKESNRIDTTVNALKSMGVKIEATDDGMRIFGTGVIMGGGVIDPKGDHRIAMSMAIAGSLSIDGCEIKNPECVRVSYPNFFEQIIG